jgi:ribA/ribD-fused uncharacterized protein
MIDSFSGDNRFLSNFWYSPVPDGEIVWTTVEHGYQFYKLINAETTLHLVPYMTVPTFKRDDVPFLKATPSEVKAWGQTIILRPDWERVKIPIMARLTKIKYQNPEMRELLLATGDAELIEGNTWNDTFWGVCNGKGHNHLGKILMAERHEIRMFA